MSRRFRRIAVHRADFQCAGLARFRGAATPIGVLLLGIILALIGASAQTEVPQPETGGKEGAFLVARPALSDPLFARSAVLMLPVKDAPLLAGLIINKRTRVSLRELFPSVGAMKNDDATAFFGGPVDIHSRSAIFRTAKAPKDALNVFGDVYVTFDSNSIAALLKNPAQASSVRIFLGRSQWGRAQLQREMLAGAWYSLRTGSDPIFSRHPDDVWRALLSRVEPRLYVERREPPVGDGAGVSSSPMD